MLPPLKERRWEVMEIGETFGPIETTVTDAMIKAFAYAVDDFDPLHLYERPGAPRLGHPTLLCREARDVIRTAYDLASGGAGMHTKHACEIHRCPVLGERVSITGRHTDKYIKRDRQTIVLASEVRGGDGGLLLSQRSTHIRALKPGVAKPPQAGGVAPALPRAEEIAQEATELAAGRYLRPLRKAASREQLVVFAGTEWPNIHNDPAVARAAGLPGCIASGLQTLAWVSELVAGYLGDGWRRGGVLDVAFTAPLLVDQTVHVLARVNGIEGDASTRRAQLDVWCDTDTGTRVLAGRASGLMPAAMP